MERSLGELAELLRGELQGDAGVRVCGVAGIKEARPGDLAFYADRRFEPWLASTQASALIIPIDATFDRLPAIRVADPRAAFLRAAALLHEDGRPLAPGVHPTALVGAGTKLGEGVAVAPHVVLGADCVIGDRVTILPGAVIGDGVVIGPDSLIYPHAVVWKGSRLGARVIVHSGAVVGDDGFGFLTREGRHVKVPQRGHVVLEDDVEIGANTCVDRATTGVTLVERGTRIDNLVQVAHNVRIGPDSILCAQVGIAGSTSVGRRVTLAGQAGVTGHIEIGDEAMVGAQGGVTKSVPAGQQVSGYPATPHARARRMYAALRHLPELVREVRRLGERLRRLEERGRGAS